MNRFASLALLVLCASFVGCADALNPEFVAKRKAAEERYAQGKALFEERCRTSAGMVIKRTVQDVEGIELIKVRPKLDWGDKRYFDPMFDGAAMAGEEQGLGYIASFLYSEHRNPRTPERRGMIKPPDAPVEWNEEPSRLGYRYVDARSPETGELLRYQVIPGMTEARRRALGGFARDLAAARHAGESARFSVDYEDIADPSDRSYWIAGTRIKIVDRQTGELIAQLTRYVWDSGFGDSSTGRLPWRHASSRVDQTCPYVAGDMYYKTRYFVDSVLVPRQGD